jgi:hypothetical protein
LPASLIHVKNDCCGEVHIVQRTAKTLHVKQSCH